MHIFISFQAFPGLTQGHITRESRGDESEFAMGDATAVFCVRDATQAEFGGASPLAAWHAAAIRRDPDWLFQMNWLIMSAGR